MRKAELIGGRGQERRMAAEHRLRIPWGCLRSAGVLPVAGARRDRGD